MKHPLLSLLAFLHFITVYSQKEIRIISLNNITPIENMDFTCVEVIDGRENKETLGTVYTGMTNNRTNAVLQGEFTETIKSSLRTLLPNDGNKSELVFIVHKLHISEIVTNSSETGFCEIELEIAQRKDSLLYSLGIYDSGIYERGLDVTNTHGRRITKGFIDCIKAFAQSNWKDNPSTVIHQINKKYTFDHRKMPAQGAYVSFGQMARNMPLINTQIEMVLGNAESKYPKYTCKIQGEENEFIKYVADSQAVYIYIGRVNGEKAFLKSKHFGRYLYFETRYADAEMTYLFGLIGLLASNQGRGLVLDTETGIVMELNEYTLVGMAKKDHPEILKAYRESRRKKEDLEEALIGLNTKFQ